jgi:DNA-binding GntR family transcriptional regulator
MQLHGAPAPSLSLSQRTSEGVARILRMKIFEGELAPGEALRERSLAEQLGVSRTPVREALFTLHSEGLVEMSPNRGATVRTMTARDIEQVYSLRAVLESYAAREMATTRTRDDLSTLLDAHTRLERHHLDASAPEQAHADLAFHLAIGDAAGSRLLQTIMRQVLAFTVSFRSQSAYPPERATVALEQHRGILDAIRAQDAPLAERLMREHVESSSRFALAHFEESERALAQEVPR